MLIPDLENIGQKKINCNINEIVSNVYFNFYY